MLDRIPGGIERQWQQLLRPAWGYLIPVSHGKRGADKPISDAGAPLVEWPNFSPSGKAELAPRI